MPLRPIQRPGSSELLTYTARDFIGVQPAGDPNHRGFNAQAEWTRNHHAWALEEHTASGLHNTPKIQRSCGDVGYFPRDGEYAPGFVWHMGQDSIAVPSLVTATWENVGTVLLTFSTPLPSLNCAVVNMSNAVVDGGTVFAVLVHGQIVSTTQVRIFRRLAGTLSPFLQDGDFSFSICGG